MGYDYKIQWAFEEFKQAKKLVDLLGATSFDEIIFHGKDGKVLDNYNGFIQYPYGLAEHETKLYINKMYKQGATRCEFIKK